MSCRTCGGRRVLGDRRLGRGRVIECPDCRDDDLLTDPFERADALGGMLITAAVMLLLVGIIGTVFHEELQVMFHVIRGRLWP